MDFYHLKKIDFLGWIRITVVFWGSDTVPYSESNSGRKSNFFLQKCHQQKHMDFFRTGLKSFHH